MKNKLKRNKKSIFTKPVAIVLLALLTCCLWGSAFPAIKTGFVLFNIETSGSKILFAGYRFFLAGIMTLVIASIMEGRLVTIKASSIPYVLMQGVIQTTIQYVCFYIGLSNTTGAKASIINGSNAFFSIIAAHFMTKNEKMTVRKVIGCIVGFAGVVAVNANGLNLFGNFSFWGEGMVLLCSISYGISTVTLKMISNRETPNAITAYQLIFGGAILIVIGWITGGHVTGFTLTSTLLLIYLALISTVSFCLWANLLKHNPVGKIAIFGFSIPVFGVFMSAVFLGEKAITMTTVIALIFVSIGITIVNTGSLDDSKTKNRNT